MKFLPLLTATALLAGCSKQPIPAVAPHPQEKPPVVYEYSVQPLALPTLADSVAEAKQGAAQAEFDLAKADASRRVAQYQITQSEQSQSNELARTVFNQSVWEIGFDREQQNTANLLKVISSQTSNHWELVSTLNGLGTNVIYLIFKRPIQ